MKSVLAIDDEPTNLLVVQELLEDEFNIECMESADNLEEYLQSNIPDIILLDVNMPGRDGYEICRWLKSEYEYSTIPVVFVSAKDTMEERLVGYDAGAYDYITKPFEYPEFLAKIRQLDKYLDHIYRIKDDYQNAFATAMQAMSGAGELGTIMQFLDDIIDCTTYRQVAERMFQTFTTFGLDVRVQIRVSGEVLSFSPDGEIKPLEEELLAKASGKGRFVDSGTYTFVNFEMVSIFIKNMPVDDQAVYGRIKDNMPSMLNGAEARLRALESEIVLNEKKKALNFAVEKIHSALGSAKHKMLDLKQHNSKLIEHLIGQMEAEFFSLDLTQEKEVYLMKILEKNKEKLASFHDDGQKLEVIFNKVIDRLQKAIN
ncbi:MAG: response regulator [Gammaproteobacteria bacterium]|nr:MAG: response regulator [Gammaproteobacteria bacterium]